jgi:hypothetical protein
MNPIEALLAAGAVFLVILLAIVIFFIACIWKIYSKAGQPGWASIVPVYNWYILVKLINKPGWWLVLFFIPFVNYVVLIIVHIQLAKAFGKGTGFGIGLILLPMIFLPMLAFGSAKYQYGANGEQGHSDILDMKGH